MVIEDVASSVHFVKSLWKRHFVFPPGLALILVRNPQRLPAATAVATVHTGYTLLVNLYLLDHRVTAKQAHKPE